MERRLTAGLWLGLNCYTRIVDFRGRATRTEVVSFFIVATLLNLATNAFAEFTGLEPAFLQTLNPHLPPGLEMLAIEHLLMLPVFALTVRRLHDIGLPGWPGPINALLGLMLGAWHALRYRIPGMDALPLGWEIARVVSLLLFYMALFWVPSRGPNRYGADPRRVETA